MTKRKVDEAKEGKEGQATRRMRRRAPSANDSSLGPSASDLGAAVAFKDAWAYLRRAGWSHKPPPRKSLDSRYQYVRPGRDAAGVEGDDYLLGEAAVLH
ncbi:hypothetical protein DVH05_002938 [Phytophthora capsici]|nr:hypothetical protein DVH05_002938 [Phytophthora capsici]|eukprot:jgi/Phyca11/124297/e_gw1.53.432.1